MKKSNKKIEWTEEADKAFAHLKRVLSTPPVLVAPKEKEPLLMYIAATHQVISTVLVVERSKEGKAHGVQRLVYFLNKVLSPSKQRYPHYKKLTYVHDSSKTVTLFRGPPNKSGQRGATIKYIEQPGSNL
jgi:hypothetical protein